MTGVTRYVQVCMQLKKLPKNWRNHSFCLQWKIQVLEEVEGCPPKSTICAIFSRNCKKLEKSQILLELEDSSVRGGSRVRHLTSYNYKITTEIAENAKKLFEIREVAKKMPSNLWKALG